MDIARYFIERKTTSWMVTAILLLGGIVAFLQLGRLEDPQFTIKEALIVAQYPGASPMQVEEEVTHPIENAIQQLPYVKKVTSISSVGLTQIIVEMKEIYRKKELQQIWDELRRKVNDLAPSLPPGVSQPQVNDDFGDVFGVLMAVSGEGYQYEDINNYVDYLRRELVLIDGVGKVTVQGQQQEQVVVELSTAKLSALGISPYRIAQILDAQNQVSNAGRVNMGDELIRFHPTGEFQSVEQLASVIISQPGAKELIYLSDVASISKEYIEIPINLTRFNGKPSLLIGLSFGPGVNVIEVGENISERLAELDSNRPAGMTVESVYQQPIEVEKSVDNFVDNLIAAVVIVFVVLLAFMGLRAGFVIGFILFLTVVGTFIFMHLMDIELQRVSLGALIIALGMLVDNAIVVAEGTLIGIQQRLTKVEAASRVVKQTQWPLLGATVIAIIAFAPIGLSPDATGEFAGSLFWVLLISLLLSWVTAITITPFFASMIFKSNGATDTQGDEQEVDPYQGIVYVVYKKFLSICLKFSKLTVVAVVTLLVIAAVGFGQVKQSFFPPSTTPMFMIDLWYPEGTDIRVNSETTKSIESLILKNPHVEHITTSVGAGAPRFMLTYDSEKLYESYSQIIVRMTDIDRLVEQLPLMNSEITAQFPDVFVKVKRLEVGPTTKAKVEVRFSGPDPKVLRELAEQASDVMRNHPGAKNIRHDWHKLTKVIRPEFNEAVGRRVGVSKQDIDNQLLTTFNGNAVGLFRDGTDMLPIIVRSPIEERKNIANLKDLQVFSRASNDYIPITQVVSDFELRYENPFVVRRDRKRTITVMADNDMFSDSTAAELFSDLKPAIEAIELPRGYQLDWGGEYEASSDAEAAIFGSLPVGYLIMFVITVMLFNSARSALVVWVSVPLAIIGVTSGLLVTGKPFGFMAMLGFLSLSGMMIKNGIVLVEQIKIELEEGKTPQQALVDAAVSRVRPVSMAAITTILGMIPLLFDDFFASMSVVIMFGLGFATLFTLIIVPVAYKLMYRIRFS